MKTALIFFSIILKTWVIEAKEIHTTLQKASEGDTIEVIGGKYIGHIEITKKISLIGRNSPVIDGRGKGHVILVKAPCIIKGLVIKNSGDNPSTEDSGILVENTRDVVIEVNRIYDVLYGVYIKNSENVLIKDNLIVGKDLPLQYRGDGIRLWYSRNVKIIGNTVKDLRDVVIWFSNGVVARKNKITGGRYGLHYMYSDGNILEENEFIENVVGAFVMYSRQIVLRRNVFAKSKYLTGIGIGFKDSTWIVVRENLIVDNTTGIYLANSPEYTGEIISHDIPDEDILSKKSYGNIIKNNVFAFNSIAIRILPPSFPNLISSNTFLGNMFLVEFEQVLEDKNFWYSNYYDVYRGYDGDGDGFGDLPFEYTSLFLKILADIPELRYIYFSPLRVVLEHISRIMPFLRPKPVFEDTRPKIKPEFFGWKNKDESKKILN